MSLPTENPFPALINTLDSVYFPAANNQIYKKFMLFFQIITIVSMLSLFVSLIVRLRRGGFWIVKIQNQWIVINYNSIYICGGIIFMLVEIPYIQLCMTNWITIGSDLHNQFIYRGLVWLPLILTAMCTSWAQLYSSISVSGNNGANQRFSFINYPKIGNSIFLLICFLFITSNVITSFIANEHWNKSFSIAVELREALVAASKDFDTGKIPNVFSLVAINLGLEAEAQKTIFYIQLNYSFLILGLAISVLSSCSSYYYFRYLNRSIRHAQQGSTELKLLKRAFITLLLVTSSSLFIQLIYIGVIVYTVIALPSIRANSLANTIIVTMSVAVYSITGLFINGVVLIQTFQFVPATKSASQISLFHSSSTKVNPIKTTPDPEEGEFGKVEKKGHSIQIEESDEKEFISTKFTAIAC